MKLKLLLSAVLATLVTAAQAESENAAMPTAATNAPDSMTALFGDPNIVKGDGFTIKRSELDQVVSSAKANAAAQNQELPAGFEASVLDQLISIHLLLQKATEADKADGKADADRQYAALIKRFGTEDALQRQLMAVGMTENELRAKATQEATAKATLKRLLNVTVTDAELKEYYTNHPSDFELPETAHVQHILLMTVDPSSHPPTPLSTNMIALKRQQIEGLLKRAQSGEDFGALARQYSEDPGSKANGGELPEFPRGQMLPEFEAAAFSLTNNQISDVVTTVYGFHIIKLLNKKPAHTLTLEEKSPTTNLTIADELRDALLNGKVRKQAPDYVKQLRTENHVVILDANLQAEEDALMTAAANQAAGAAAGADNTVK
jgi:parvulin-like peptidyl-prolyl isomerase